MKLNWGKWVPVITLLVLFLAFSLTEEAFLTDRNLTNLARQVSVNGILACGMTLIILLGAIDLSLGSVLALGAVVGALMQQNLGFYQGGWEGAVICSLGAIAVCTLCSSTTGFLVSRFAIPSFVVTLGLLVTARGLALIFSDGSRIGPLSESYRWLGTGFLSPLISLILIVATAVICCVKVLLDKDEIKWKILKIFSVVAISGMLLKIFYGYQGIPVPVLALGIVFVVIAFILKQTIFGRYIYAIGGNREAARLCGIRVPVITFGVYVLMGILVGLASLIESGRIDAGDPNAGNLYELDAIAAVVIGGTSLSGGVGSVGGTLLGALLMGTLNNGMSLMNIETNRQMVIKGVIIVVAVLIDVVSSKKAK